VARSTTIVTWPEVASTRSPGALGNRRPSSNASMPALHGAVERTRRRTPPRGRCRSRAAAPDSRRHGLAIDIRAASSPW
jgi:hypothetical protein